jgi:dolichol-phosphate mannosyltransferase
MDKIVIVMPAYNEAANIGKMIDALCGEEFPKIDKVKMLLLIVDDFSPDGTGNIVKEKMKQYKMLYLLQGKKNGLGMAYVRGMRYAMKMLGADAVMEMDADFQHPPRFVKPMVDAYLNGAEYVIGSRYIKGGSVPKEWAMFRKLVSYFGNLYIRLVLLKPKVHDLTTGFRLTKVKGILDRIKLENLMEVHRFAYKVDLLYQSLKLAKVVKEVPLQFAARTAETSKFDSKEMTSTFKVATILGIKDKIRIIKFGVVGFVGFVVNYGGLLLLKRTGLTVYWATLIATELAIISNFIWNNVWTFKEQQISNLKDLIVQFLKFNLSSAFAVIVQPVIVAWGASIFGDTSLVNFASLLFALVFVMIYNYIVYNIFIWKTWKLPHLFGKQ